MFRYDPNSSRVQMASKAPLRLFGQRNRRKGPRPRGRVTRQASGNKLEVTGIASRGQEHQPNRSAMAELAVSSTLTANGKASDYLVCVPCESGATLTT